MKCFVMHAKLIKLFVFIVVVVAKIEDDTLACIHVANKSPEKLEHVNLRCCFHNLRISVFVLTEWQPLEGRASMLWNLACRFVLNVL